MASYNSEQIALTAGQGAERLSNGDNFGRIRSTFFSFNTTDELGGATLTTADVADLVLLPAGARILGLFLANEDLGTTVTTDFGLYGADGNGYISKDGTTTADDIDFFKTGYALGTAVNAYADITDDVTKTGFLTDKPVYVRATFTTVSTPTADKEFSGYVQYVVD